MYRVQWVSLRGVPRIRFEHFIDFGRALKFWIEKDMNSYVERAELIVDKGYRAAARSTDEWQSIEEMLAYLEGRSRR